MTANDKSLSNQLIEFKAGFSGTHKSDLRKNSLRVDQAVFTNCFRTFKRDVFVSQPSMICLDSLDIQI